MEAQLTDLKTRLEKRALFEGFAKMRITRPDAVPHLPEALSAFVGAGYHGQMQWMAERMHWRANPAALWPEARSIILLAENYTPKTDPRAATQVKEGGVISVYAQGKDYHDLVKRRLKRLGRWLIEQEPCEIKVFVDTAPVMEKPLAQAAGLGWQGKHTNLLARDLGNWLFLGVIFTTADLPPDTAEISHCGSCRACLEACPTGAFPEPYKMDARRCISYLTIEHRGPVDQDLRPLLGNRIYGCDECLAACPWNKFAQEAREIGYANRQGTPPLADLLALDDAAFRAQFAGSPIKRIGRDRMVRNALYAAGNSGLPALIPPVRALFDDPDPTVAEAARWAHGRLAADAAQ
ncbi:tRNA epoxyqueuosine(34) reductase QueG [Rhodobacter sp. TJ_12]|uniref:tRNA epoxyqueuosine(34) reductase QueG n=1 Tax=Rhodobacter sp. TJ_12 TaxID=2029399 RepID=UPI001CBACA28|nr:tRNA epoxyqueuosine(34) reductase QueG [Rhodobacter sp. TJ_12]MBZ4021273.1 tRNA epoxyqueuosine(34) reductase QueG [Rhodobacter sp. TJ_12]